MTTETTLKPGERVTVTEEDLSKALDELSPQQPNEQTPAEPHVQVLQLSKSTTEDLKARPRIRQAIDVSETLDELVDAVGGVVDRSNELMEKALNDAADRDHKMIVVLTGLSKTITALKDDVAKLMGGTPQTPAGNRPITVNDTQVLEKATGATPGNQPIDKTAQADPKKVRPFVLQGLEKMIREVPPGDPQGQRWTGILAKFESTGVIDEISLAKALSAAGVTAGKK